jgi:hypothetical protein
MLISYNLTCFFSRCLSRGLSNYLDFRCGPAEAIVSWYSQKIETLPRFRKPETMIDFRNSVARESFLNTVINEYLRGTNSGTPDTMRQHLAKAMEHQIDIARRVAGESYQFKKTLLSGLFATLGGIVGGVSGAHKWCRRGGRGYCR